MSISGALHAVYIFMYYSNTEEAIWLLVPHRYVCLTTMLSYWCESTFVSINIPFTSFLSSSLSLSLLIFVSIFEFYLFVSLFDYLRYVHRNTDDTKAELLERWARFLICLSYPL